MPKKANDVLQEFDSDFKYVSWADNEEDFTGQLSISTNLKAMCEQLPIDWLKIIVRSTSYQIEPDFRSGLFQ